MTREQCIRQDVSGLLKHFTGETEESRENPK
jgi:hypothetical protein